MNNIMRDSERTKILLVEDELIIGEHISRKLEEHGYAVIDMITKGEDALAFLSRTEVDLVIMDIQLAGELDGIETAKLILSIHKIPVIFLTANADDLTFKKSILAAPYAFMRKPFKLKELTRNIQMVMQRVKHE